MIAADLRGQVFPKREGRGRCYVIHPDGTHCSQRIVEEGGFDGGENFSPDNPHFYEGCAGFYRDSAGREVCKCGARVIWEDERPSDVECLVETAAKQIGLLPDFARARLMNAVAENPREPMSELTPAASLVFDTFHIAVIREAFETLEARRQKAMWEAAGFETVDTSPREKRARRIAGGE